MDQTSLASNVKEANVFGVPGDEAAARLHVFAHQDRKEFVGRCRIIELQPNQYGETLYNFALALTIGICFGIYSSVLVASPLVMWLGVSREQFIKPKKEKEEAVV